MELEIFVFATVLAGALVQSSTGFGYAILVMALWPLALSVPDTTQLLMFGCMVTSGYIAFKYRKHINLKLVLIPLILGLAGNYIGLTILLGMDNMVAVRIIGVLLVLLSVYLYFFSGKVKIPSNIWASSLAGAASGLMGGFFNIAGPPIVLYYSAAARDKEEYNATVQFLFSVLIACKIVYLFVVRGLPETVLRLTPPVVVGSVLGMLIGLYLFDRLSTVTIKKLIYIFMFFSGLWYILRP